MRITDIIRGILDQVDATVGHQDEPEVRSVGISPVAVVSDEPCPCEPEPESDLIAIIQQLAGLPTEPDYANEPKEMTAPLGAAFPGGDDMHARKDPSDIRTNAPSMYPGFQAGVK